MVGFTQRLYCIILVLELSIFKVTSVKVTPIKVTPHQGEFKVIPTKCELSMTLDKENSKTYK